MRMLKNAAVFIAFGLLTLPAQAAWENTRWGISPAEALATLDGAEPYQATQNDIYSDANGAEGTLSVWAMNNSGASKIAEFASDPFPSIFSPGGPATGVNWPTLGFGPDDAVYLTTSSLDAQTGEYTTTVHLISGPSPL